ncbi:MAG: methionine synthase [Bacteroidales bacterium]|nr:methionine synthase [Candidatus Cryptobacteroides caccocaballi]
MKGILIIDGAMGTMLQKRGLSGNNDMFNLTRPEDIAAVHRAYIDAGADIIETCTFSSNAISQMEYGCQDKAREMALAGARIARKVADDAMSEQPGRKILVAGSLGPTSKSLSIGTDVDDPTWRPVSFDEMSRAYGPQISGLIEGGVDLILIETCIDALNAKAAIYNIPDGFPVAVSVSCADKSGRVLTGQTLEAFYHSIKHCNLVSYGLNCSLGAKELMPLIADVSRFVREDAPGRMVSCYPNAGLPNELGQYDQSPAEMAEAVSEMVRAGYVDIIGGCCGTTPEHIAAIAEAVRKEGRQAIDTESWWTSLSHPAPDGNAGDDASPVMTVSGLEAVTIDKEKTNFTNVGERTNVAGSRKFAKLIAAGDYAAGIEIAQQQIANGASVIDINMDDAMLDSTVEMEKFVRYIATEPAVAKAALMIDSSHWETILAGLKNAQGKCIVNSISLKEGEQEFLRKASEIHRLGAAMVVMAFDEEGQATDYDRKISICERAYGLLTGIGIAPNDIIFDCNVLTVGTGVGTDRRYGVDFIEAVRWIKSNLPGALTSGGISNLSFAFRGNNPVREAMHSVFLYHAIAAGLDMAIVNPGMLQIYDAIEPKLRKACEDVILDSDDGAVERLLSLASEAISVNTGGVQQNSVRAELSLPDLLVKGSSEGLHDKVMKALEELGSAQGVIQGPLMEGMETVGNYFGEGKMFLPQVVKSAKIMKEAVDILQPYMTEGKDDDGSEDNRPVVVMATVKGDVHDIGKNITDTVLTCNGFRVIDLGVMVDKESILDTAIREKASIIGVSGLITPSLHQMEEICKDMASRGMSIPLFVGGATTSARHTALKLAPLYRHVFHGADASSTAVMAKHYMMDPMTFEAQEHERQEQIRINERSAETRIDAKQDSGLFTYLDMDGYASLDSIMDNEIPVRDVPLDEVSRFMDWGMFNMIWRIKKSDWEKPEVKAIRAEAEQVLANMKCNIRVAVHFEMVEGKPLGLFAASVHGLHMAGCNCELCRKESMMEKTLRLCLAEAASEWIGAHLSVPDGMKMIRPGIGYPSCPEHRRKKDVLDGIPDSDRLCISLTESYAMFPESSICGYIVIHRDAHYI